MKLTGLECKIKVICGKKSAESIFRTLKPEEVSTDRADVAIEKVKNVVVISINAKDPIIARSLMNSYLRILSAIEQIKI